MSSCFGLETPASDWIVLNICFRFEEDFCYENPMFAYHSAQDKKWLTFTAIARIKPTSSRVVGM
jgi:hypothetical protein